MLVLQASSHHLIRVSCDHSKYLWQCCHCDIFQCVLSTQITRWSESEGERSDPDSRKTDESLLKLISYKLGSVLEGWKVTRLMLSMFPHFHDSPASHLKAPSCICCSLSWALRRPWTAALREKCQTDQERIPLKRGLRFVSQSFIKHWQIHNLHNQS